MARSRERAASTAILWREPRARILRAHVLTARNLLLHYVSDGPPARRLTVSRAGLRELVAGELEERRHATLLDYLAQRVPGNDRFTISFDDAHRSLLDHALPVLRELGVTATVFVPTAYVGTSDEWLDWDGLRRLRDEGWTIGSHTHTHPRMGLRLYAETEEQHQHRLVNEELYRSRELIESELGEPPRLFAYPYGEAPEFARLAVRNAHFDAAFTVNPSSAWTGDLLHIPRSDAMELAREGPEVEPGDEPIGLSVIVPACDRVRILSDVVTRLASQAYPRDHYEVIVVDDGSREDPTPIFRKMPRNVRLVRQGDERFRAGQARQRGAREARFSTLVFLDADVAVPPDFLWHHEWVHQRTPDAVVLGYLSGYNLHDLGFLHTPADVIGQNIISLPVIPDRSREPVLRTCLDNLDWLEDPWPLTYTGNLSLPKALLERVGGFADELVGWGLEDVDLGIRLARAGARFVFSRYALGYHVVDPDEAAVKNPFRKPSPTRADFAGYLENLAILRRRHAGDLAVRAYADRSLADIEEICSRPKTVGIEMGGEATLRTPYHARLHRVQPGGAMAHELLERVAYAKKVGAETIYLLGGEPAEHPAYYDVLDAAAEAVGWISMQSLVHSFDMPLVASVSRDAGLRGVVAMTFAFDRAAHEALHGPGTYERFLAGLDSLERAGVELSAHLVVTRETERLLESTLRELDRRGLEIVELSVTEPDLVATVEAACGRPPALR